MLHKPKVPVGNQYFERKNRTVTVGKCESVDESVKVPILKVK